MSDPIERLQKEADLGAREVQQPSPPAGSPEELTPEKAKALLQPIMDPELNISIVDLGLIYGVDIQKTPEGPKVRITMTLTSPGCPLGPQIRAAAQLALQRFGVKDVEVELTFDPPWDPKTMPSEDAKMELGIY